MNAQAKKEFIEDLINMVRDDILSKVDAMPEEWDGVELREYIKDRFVDCTHLTALKGARRGAFRNTLLTNGVL